METTFNSFFYNFSTYLNDTFSRPVDQEKEDIRNGPIRVRRLDSLARLIIRDDTENCAAVGLVNNQWLITANNPEKIKANAEHIMQSIRLIYEDNGRVRTKRARIALLAYLNAKSDVPNFNKLTKDVRKFLSSLKTNTIFNKKEIRNLLKEGFKSIDNINGLHAEIMLLLRLSNIYKNAQCKVELGISKLCCRLCASGIFAFQKTFNNIKVQVRGRHGNFYFKWTPSRTLFFNNIACFEVFVGNEAFQIYYTAKPAEQEKIRNALMDLDLNREVLKAFFTPQRGAVIVNSDSSAAPDTESPQQLDPETVSAEVYYSDSDAAGDSED